MQFEVLGDVLGYGAFPHRRRSQDADPDWLEGEKESIFQSFSSALVYQRSTIMSSVYQQSPGVPVLLHDTPNVLHQTRSTQPVEGEQVFDVDSLHSKVDHHGVNFHDLPRQEGVNKPVRHL